MNRLNISILILTIATALTAGIFGLIVFTKSEIERPQLGCATVPMDFVLPLYDGPVEHPGRMIFEQNCKVCHRLDQNLVGPALRNVFELRDSLWNIKMIRNAQKLREDGDSLAIQIFHEYNDIQHTNFEQMPDSTLKKLVTYLVEEGKHD